MVDSQPISVVIPSFQGGARLHLILQALTAQTTPDDEILVIDDCSTDDTAEVARRFGATVHTMAVNSGVGRCRNEGLRRAKYDIQAFFDDDVIPLEGYLDAVRGRFADPEVMICQGPHTPEPVLPNPDIWEQAEAIMWHHSLTTKWVRKGRCSTLYSGHFCVRRPFLLEVGLFREDFGRAGGEEFEIAGRILQRATIVYAPELLSRHQPKSLWPRIRAIFYRAQFYKRVFKGNTAQDRAILTDKIRFVLAGLIPISAALAVYDARLLDGLTAVVLIYIVANGALLFNLLRWKRFRFIPILLVMRLLQYWAIGLGMSVGVLRWVGNSVKRLTLKDSGGVAEDEGAARRAGKD